jgi:hypothetical protein
MRSFFNFRDAPIPPSPLWSISRERRFLRVYGNRQAPFPIANRIAAWAALAAIGMMLAFLSIPVMALLSHL